MLPRKNFYLNALRLLLNHFYQNGGQTTHVHMHEYLHFLLTHLCHTALISPSQSIAWRTKVVWKRLFYTICCHLAILEVLLCCNWCTNARFMCVELVCGACVGFSQVIGNVKQPRVRKRGVVETRLAATVMCKVNYMQVDLLGLHFKIL